MRPPRSPDFRADYVAGSTRGSGRLSCLWRRHAVVEDAKEPPAPGAPVWLVLRPDDGRLLELFGRVVGPRGDGFAVELTCEAAEAIALWNEPEEQPAAGDAAPAPGARPRESSGTAGALNEARARRSTAPPLAESRS